MENENSQNQLEEEEKLYSMPLPDLNQLAGELEAKRCEGSKYPGDARKRNPHEQRVMEIWLERNQQQLREENLAEYYKKLLGEPNHFDEYAPH